MSVQLKFNVACNGSIIGSGGARYGGYTDAAIDATKCFLDTFEMKSDEYDFKGHIAHKLTPYVIAGKCLEEMIEYGHLDWINDNKKETDYRYSDGNVTVDIGTKMIKFDSFSHYEKSEEEEALEYYYRSPEEVQIILPKMVPFAEFEDYASLVESDIAFRTEDGELILKIE